MPFPSPGLRKLTSKNIEWVAIFSSRDLPDSGIELESLVSSALAGRFFTIVPLGKPKIVIAEP